MELVSALKFETVNLSSYIYNSEKMISVESVEETKGDD